MSEPLIYITTWKVKEGRLEDYRQFFGELLKFIKERESQLIAIHAFLNEDGTEMTSIQVHPDAASMDFHMQVVNQVLGEEMNDWVERADFLEPKSVDIFGTPSTALMEADQPFVDMGLPRGVKPLHIGGFTRSAAG